MSQRSISTYPLALTANVLFQLEIDGNAFGVVDCTGEFTATFDQSNRIQKLLPGRHYKFLQPYKTVSFLSTTTQTIYVDMGFGETSDGQASVNATINTTISPSDTLDNTADITVGVAATLLKAASATTKEVLIHVPSDAANSIRVGGATVTATTGIEVEPGSTLAIACEAALYGIRDGASDVAVSTLKLSRV